MKLRVSLPAAAAVIALLTACGGRSVTQPGGGETVCPFFIPLEQLVYPAPGSTGIPDAPSAIVVSGGIDYLTLQPPGGPAIVAVAPAPVPSPLPSPYATPVAAATHAFAVPALAAATTYTVTAQTLLSGPCPYQHSLGLGSFTTR